MIAAIVAAMTARMHELQDKERKEALLAKQAKQRDELAKKKIELARKKEKVSNVSRGVGKYMGQNIMNGKF